MKTPQFLIGLILLLGFALRLFHLSLVPPSLNWDETSVLWNANSIVKTGTDEFGNLLPVSIRSFDDFKPPLLTYAAVGSVTVFGPSEFAVRFPSALFGALTILVVFLLIKQLTKNDTLSLLSALFLAVSPWHLVFSRIAFEASIALFFFALATLFLTKFLSLNSARYLLAAMISFVLAFYTHHSVRVAFPLFFIGILIYYRRVFLPRWKPVLAIFFLVGFLILPLFYSNWRYRSLQARFGQTSIFYSPGLKDIAKMFTDLQTKYRIEDEKDSSDVGGIFHNGVLTYSRLFFRNYLDHFNFDFLFLSGDNNPRHRVPGVGMLLIFQLPLILFGVYSLIKKRPSGFFILAWWFLVAPMASALTTETPHASRAFLLMLPLQVISAFGILEILKSIRSVKIPKLLIPVAISINIFYFLHQYFVHLPLEDGRFWQSGYKELVQRVKTLEADYQDIYITKTYDQPYIYFLLYGNIDPAEKNPGTFSEQFGKYHFVNFGAMPDQKKFAIPREDLLVLADLDVFTDIRVIDTVNFPDGSPAFRLAQRM